MWSKLLSKVRDIAEIVIIAIDAIVSIGRIWSRNARLA